MNVLAIDVGTSAVKAAVLSLATGRRHGPIVRVNCPLEQPTGERAEIPASRLWAAVVEAARKASDGRAVSGVGLSVMTPALVLLDSRGRPLTPIITHLDRRSRAEALQVWNDVGRRFLRSTGNRPLPGGISAVVWTHLFRARPELARRVARYLHLNGWLGLEMTGRTAFDPGNASFTGLFDTMGKREWSAEWCSYFGVQSAWLPEVRPGDATLGLLTRRAAADLGLPAGIPVKLGAADTSCAMLAAGVTENDLLHVVGTTQVLAAYAARPRPAADRLTRLLGVGDRYIHVAHNPVGGAALEWLHRLCFRDLSRRQFYRQAVADALARIASGLKISRPRDASSPPANAPRRAILADEETGATAGVVLDPPFLGGDRLEIEPRTAAFRRLTLAADRTDLLAALLHAMRRHHQTALAGLGPRRFDRIFLSGGGADVVRRLLADLPQYADARIQLLQEASLHGAARLFSSRHGEESDT